MYNLISSMNPQTSLKRESEDTDIFYDTYGINSPKPKKSKLETNSFTCEFCSRSFANTANLKQHVESFHSKNTTWTCSECKKVTYLNTFFENFL